jgi:N-methylhydantoinase B/oxoprolinase/acetone carboxylase alpha subunit
MASARDVYEEGALLFHAVRVQTDYTDNEDILRSCRLRIRVPEQWWGDYLALLGAVRVGERRILEMGKELGWDELAQRAQEADERVELVAGLARRVARLGARLTGQPLGRRLRGMDALAQLGEGVRRDHRR